MDYERIKDLVTIALCAAVMIVIVFSVFIFIQN
jgi:hypothetical protein